jgi:hypothetical protein
MSAIAAPVPRQMPTDARATGQTGSVAGIASVVWGRETPAAAAKRGAAQPPLARAAPSRS